MCKHNFWKGMAVGAAVGMAAGVMLMPKRSRAHCAARLIRCAGDLVERLGGVMGF